MTTFTLANIKKGIRKVPLKALIYGPNGVGKSHFAKDFPEPIYMDIEGNLDHLNLNKQRIRSWEEAKDFVLFLSEEKHPYKTLVVDSLDQLQSYAAPVACRAVGIKNINEGYGKGVVQLVGLFEGFRTACDVLFEEKHMNLIFIAHSKIQRVQDLEQGARDITTPSPNDRVSSLFLDWCNLVGYAHRLLQLDCSVDVGHGKEQKTMKEKEDEHIGSRVLRVVDSPSIIAKETFGLINKDGNISLDATRLLNQIQNFYNQSNIQKGE